MMGPGGVLAPTTRPVAQRSVHFSYTRVCLFATTRHEIATERTSGFFLTIPFCLKGSQFSVKTLVQLRGSLSALMDPSKVDPCTRDSIYP